ITESKLDASISDEEVKLEGYELLRTDRNRKGGGVACYVRDNICYTRITGIFNDIEYVAVKLLLPKTKPILVGTFYRPPNQINFLEKLNENFESLGTENVETFLLGDFNINLFQNGRYMFNSNKNRLVSTDNSISGLFKKYKEFCTSYGLNQLIVTPTRIACQSSSLIDHILTNSPNTVVKSGVIEVGLSDHQLIFCTRKISKIKYYSHRSIKARSFKKYTSSEYVKALEKMPFPDYEVFTDINSAYSDFCNKILTIIDKIAPIRESRLKGSTQAWFDGEIRDKIALRDRLFKKFKKNNLQINHDIYREARIKTKKAICGKKVNFFEDKLKQNIGKHKELWKTLKDLGLPNKKSSGSTKVCLKKDNEDVCFDSKSNAEIFMNFFSDLAKNLVCKLPTAPNKYTIESLINYYSGKAPDETFSLKRVSEDEVIKILSNLDISKAAGIDNIKGVFLKDGASILGKPIAKLCNLSIKLSTFPDKCKVAKLKPLFKKGSKTEPKNYRPISLLPLISKIFEKVVLDQTQKFLNENKVLYNYQSGFRSSHSTAFALTYLNDKILQGFDKGLVTGMILIDLQKAFDTIDHGILL
ncbi:MAG: reverse transcriptase domain-containing protein, partial [Pseudomonadales bacterium]